MKHEPGKLTLWRRQLFGRIDRSPYGGAGWPALRRNRTWPRWVLAGLVGTGSWQMWQATHPSLAGENVTGAWQATPDPRRDPDRVWLNLASGVYHQPGCRHYETSGKGMLVPLEEARSHGRACQTCLSTLPANWRSPGRSREGRALVLP